MRLARALLGTAGAFVLAAGGAAAHADEPTQIRLVEVYEMTPGVSATHQVTLSTDHALIGEQCQSMGTAAQATSSLLVDAGGVTGCRFTWNLEEARCRRTTRRRPSSMASTMLASPRTMS